MFGVEVVVLAPVGERGRGRVFAAVGGNCEGPPWLLWYLPAPASGLRKRVLLVRHRRLAA